MTLSATWLLTPAVIPGTWEEKDFPRVTRAAGEKDNIQDAGLDTKAHATQTPSHAVNLQKK